MIIMMMIHTVYVLEWLVRLIRPWLVGLDWPTVRTVSFLPPFPPYALSELGGPTGLALSLVSLCGNHECPRSAGRRASPCLGLSVGEI